MKYTSQLILLAGSIVMGVQASAADNQFFPLDFRVFDAEYSASLDKIIMVSSTPSNQLYIYDPQTLDLMRQLLFKI